MLFISDTNFSNPFGSFAAGAGRFLVHTMAQFRSQVFLSVICTTIVNNTCILERTTSPVLFTSRRALRSFSIGRSVILSVVRSTKESVRLSRSVCCGSFRFHNASLPSLASPSFHNGVVLYNRLHPWQVSKLCSSGSASPTKSSCPHRQEKISSTT